MDREKRKDSKEILEIPKAEMIDFWEEGSEYVMYSKWDSVFDWFRRMWEKIGKRQIGTNRFVKTKKYFPFLERKKDLEIFWS